MMKVVCAECKRGMGEKMGPDVVTHGICPECMKKLYPEYYVHPEFPEAYARHAPTVELVPPRYRCAKCGDDVAAVDLRETDGVLEHPSEGDVGENGAWHQLWCGPCEEVPAHRGGVLEGMDDGHGNVATTEHEAEALTPEDEDETEEDDSDGVDEDEELGGHAEDCDCTDCEEERAVERENAEDAR